MLNSRSVFGVARSSDPSQRKLWLYTARWWSRRGVLHAKRPWPLACNSREDSKISKDSLFPFVGTSLLIFSLLTCEKGPARSQQFPTYLIRKGTTHWQVAKALMARQHLGWESAEAWATSLLELPSLMGFPPFAARFWDGQRWKNRPSSCRSYFPWSCRRLGLVETERVTVQCFTDILCGSAQEALKTFRWDFPSRASRDSRIEAWVDDCVHRASIGWVFSCGFVTWVQANPRSNMTGTICDPGESCFDYLWLLGSIAGLAPGFYESWDSWHAILVRDSSQWSFPKGRGVACDRKFWSLVTASFGRLWPQELLQCHFSWQAQYLVMLEFHFLWQAHYLVMLECHFCWQAQHWLKFG